MACMVALYCLLLLAVGRLDPRIFLRKYAPSMLTTFSLGSSNAAVPYTMLSLIHISWNRPPRWRGSGATA